MNIREIDAEKYYEFILTGSEFNDLYAHCVISRKESFFATNMLNLLDTFIEKNKVSAEKLSDDGILTRILNLRRDFMTGHLTAPKYLYVGKKEMLQINNCSSLSFMNNHFMRLKIVEVNLDSFLQIG